MSDDNKQLTTIGNRGVQLQDTGNLFDFAKAVAGSSFCPRGMKYADIALAIQSGLELGISPMQALQNIAVINGKPSVYGDLALALCNDSGMVEMFQERFEGKPGTDGYMAICETKRRDRDGIIRGEFSVSDAKAANLWGKSGPWSQYPKRMLQMRARSFCLRDAYPEALKGLSVREEAQDILTEPRNVTPAAATVESLEDSLETQEPEVIDADVAIDDVADAKCGGCGCTVPTDELFGELCPDCFDRSGA